MTTKLRHSVIILGILCLTGTRADARINVAVSILPQAYLAEEIGREQVAVFVMIPPGGDPHTYEPTPGQMKNLTDAALYIKVGSGIEFERQWLKKISSFNKTMRVVNSSRGIALIPMAGHPGHDHGHPHGHGGMDPYVWLAPSNAMIMAMNIRDALVEADPDNASFYRANAAELILALSDLKKEIARTLAGLENRKFIVFHPAWGYFAHDFGLEQIAIEFSGKDPTPKQLARLIRQAKKTGARVVFASPQFSQKSAQTIAGEINGRVELIDPLTKDYREDLRAAARLIAGQDQ